MSRFWFFLSGMMLTEGVHGLWRHNFPQAGPSIFMMAAFALFAVMTELEAWP